MWEGGKEEDDLEPWRGFQVRVDLCCLGAITQSIREREGEKKNKRKHNTCLEKEEKKERIYEKCMNMWREKIKSIMRVTQSKPNSTQQQ